MRELALLGKSQLENHLVWKALVVLAQSEGKERARECCVVGLSAVAVGSTVEDSSIVVMGLVKTVPLVDHPFHPKSWAGVEDDSANLSAKECTVLESLW